MLYAYNSKKHPDPNAVRHYLNLFFDRIQARRLAVAEKGVSKELAPYIQKVDLAQIYQYILSNESTIREKLARQYRRPNQSLLFIKEGTKLVRSFILVEDINFEYRLLLNLESKLKDNSPDPNAFKRKGTYKKVICDWQIDCEPPKPWAHGYTQSDNNTSRSDNLFECYFSQELAKERAEFFSYTLFGKVEGPPKVQHFYSQMASGTLHDFVNKKFYFSELEKALLLLQLFNGLYIIHGKNQVHQDIKSKNVNIFENEGMYSLKIGDFGQYCVRQNGTSKKYLFKLAVATPGYESPEIALAYQKPDIHKYYHRVFSQNGSYAQDLIQDKQVIDEQRQYYTFPHPANDIWAAGILAFWFFEGRLPCIKDRKTIEAHPLLSGLLAVEREKRFTAIEAIAKINENYLGKTLELHVHTKQNLEKNVDIITRKMGSASFKIGR
jgi:hypothetical protein